MDANYQPRIRGVRQPETQVPAPPEIGRPDASQIRAGSFETFQNTVQGLLQSNQRAGQAAFQMVEDIAGTEMSRGLQAAYRLMPNQTQGTQNTVNAIMTFADRAITTWGELEKQREQRRIEQAQREEEMRKALQIEAYTDATTRLTSEVLPHARAALIEQGGFLQYKRVIDEYLQQYRGLISPEDYVKLVTQAYEPVLATEQQFADNRFRQSNEVQDQLREAASSQFLIENSQRLARLGAARDPVEAQGLVDEILGFAQEFVATADPYTGSYVISRVLQEVRSNYDTSNANVLGLVTGLENYQEYAVIMQQAQDNFNRTGDINSWRYTEANARIRYGIPDTIALRDPTDQIRTQREVLQASRDIEDLQRSNAITALEGLEYTNAQMTSLAFAIYSNPELAPILKQEFEGSAIYAQAEILANQMRDFDTRGVEIQQELNTLAIQAQQIQTTNLANIAEWMNDSGNVESLTELMQIPGIRRAIGEEQAAVLESLQQGQQVDPEALRQARQAVIDARGDIIQTIESQRQLLIQEYEGLKQRLDAYNLADPEQREAIAAGALEQINGLRRSASELRAASQRTFGATPNFNIPRLASVEIGGTEIITPFQPGDSGSLWVTGQYGDRRGDRTHQGIDISAPIGTSLYSYVQGRVIFAQGGWNGGYGHVIDILSPDGYVHRFAHLSDIRVQEGDTVAPGQEIGNVGSTGRSDGPHLHWEVLPYENGLTQAAINPIEYVSGLQRQAAMQPRNGGGNSRVPEGAIDNGDGTYIYQNRIYRPDGTSDAVSYTPGQPYRARYASSNRADYGPNDGEGNFGYARLQQDRPARLALHRTASRLGIPAQWLADLIAFETGGTFSPSIANQGGHPAVGLIQFYEDSPGAGGKTIGGRFYTLNEIANMSVERQFELVYDYLAPMRSQLRTPYHVLMAVWGGSGNLARLEREGFEAVRNISDGFITFGEYARRLGSHAGREYAPLNEGRGGPVHTSYTPGCRMCVAQVSSLSDSFAHIART